ncbi:Hypothetical predicted protein [Cloeon dipterum]|uniref:Vitellogenin domain-containing protein n=1 Tax=Cloeon dipterum TaxID=197152 RepID=A0A8S1DYN6_9INSE|nr:Hypothetical predicted protein [Cloeon dipterum]
MQPFLLLLLLAGAANAASPIRVPATCGNPECAVSERTKFKYNVDTEYLYKYNANVTTFFFGTNQNASTLLIDTEVSIRFITHCEAYLELKKSAIVEAAIVDGAPFKGARASANTASFAEALQEHPLRFSFEDGVIEEVCPHLEELSWVLNFKRGVLSSFQNTMERFDVEHYGTESDVNGDCETEYSFISPRETSLVLRKMKHLNTCTSRFKQHSIIQTTPYQFPSRYNSIPLMSSKSECTVVVDHNVYSSIECVESHLFQPFSNHERGAKTEVKYRMELREEISSTAPLVDQVDRRTTLTFDHKQTPKPASSEIRVSRQMLKNLCAMSADGLQEEFTDSFKKLIQTLRLLTTQALNQIYTRAQSVCSSGRKHLKSALPHLGTNAALTLMKDVILKNELPVDEAKDWLFAIALTPLPDEETLEAVGPLLKLKNLQAEAVLTVSAVVHSYRRTHPDASEQKLVLEIVYHLEQIARAECQTKEVQTDTTKVVSALKALGNIGISTPTLNQTLQLCTENELLQVETRIAAIEAHRRLPCEFDRSYLRSILRDQYFDSELRIAAYTEVMRCPSYQLIKTVKSMLKTEEVNQVGSYIMSHLETLKRSSIPSRVEIQGLLTDANLRTKFSHDVRKYSQHFEKSVYHEGYNVGGNVEGGIVFSPKSYVPRSGKLNFTLDMFGESINILEVSSRIEGFEQYVEAFFGPSGNFSQTKVKEKVDMVKQMLRMKRDARPDYKEKIENMGSELFKDGKKPKVTFGMRIFGNELKYLNYEGEDQVKTLFETLNPKSRLQNVLNQEEVNFEKSTMFLDSMYVVPTGVGLPINLNAIGTAAIDFKTSGSFKAPKLLETGEMDIDGLVKPSVVLEVTGSMSVDAYFSTTNIEVKTNLYSAAAVQCQVKVRGKNLISASFSLPKDRMEIFSAKSELFLRRDGQNEQQEGVQEGRTLEKVCAWAPLEQMFGLKLCIDYQYPNTSIAQLNSSSPIPPLPFTGPVRFSANLLKTDPSVRQYLVEFKWDAQENSTLLSFTFDTPGSTKPRQFSTRLEINRDDKTSVQLVLQTSQAKWEAQGEYLNTPDDVHAKFGLAMNGAKQIQAEIGMRRVVAKNGHIYYPKVYFAKNETELANLGGSVRREEKKGITQWQVNLKMVLSTNLNTNVTGYIKKTDTSLAANVTFNYQLKSAKPERARVEFDLRQKNSKGVEQKQGEFRLDSTAYPYFNIAGSAKYVKIQTLTDFKVDIKGSQQDENNWSVSMVFLKQLSIEMNKLTTFFEILKPIKKIDFRVGFDGFYKEHEQNATASLRYATDKEMMASVYRKKHKQYQEGKAVIKLPTYHPMVINGTVTEKSSSSSVDNNESDTQREYDINVDVAWFTGNKHKVGGTFHDKRLLSHRTLMQTNYQLKLVVTSEDEGSEETVINAKYHYEKTSFKVEVQATHGKNIYAFGMKYKTPTELLHELFFDAKYKTQVYSLSLIGDLKEEKQLMVDLHLDKMRDISITYSGLNLPNQKKFNVEVKWDVNRDPEQKINFGLTFENPEVKNYSATAMLAYPGRTVNLAFKGALKGINFDAIGRCQWAPDQFVEASSRFQRYVRTSGQHFVINAELLTPFTNWTKTKVNTELEYGPQKFLLGGDLHWQSDQNMIYNISGRYDNNDDYIFCIYNGTIVSTIEGIPSVTSHFVHNQTSSSVKTDVHLQRGRERLLVMKSDWKVLVDSESKNLTGKMDMISPFQGYKHGKLIGRMVVKGESEIYGVADLKVEDKNYRIDLNGKFESFAENMLILNATTPEPKTFAFLARLGYSEKNRHFVAQFSKPGRSLGAEVLLQIESMTEFNIIMDLATPFEILQKLSFKGQASNEQVDLRASFNEYNVGLSGLWQYKSSTNFVYSFIIYTPLPGYEKNGIVVKFIKETDNLDAEASITIADARVGVTAMGVTKKPSNQLEDEVNADFVDETESGSDEEEEESEPLYWSLRVEVDTLIYPPVVSNLLIHETETDLYLTRLKIDLPQGPISLNDTMYFVDFFDIKNDLFLTTPWQWLGQMSHHHYFFMDSEDGVYKLKSILNLQHNEQLIDTGFEAESVFVQNKVKGTSQREFLFHIHSPLEYLRLVHLNGTLNTDKGGYQFIFDGALGNNTAELDVYLKADQSGLIDFGSEVDVRSVYFELPKIKVGGMQVLHRQDSKMRSIAFDITVFTEEPIKFDVQLDWNFEPPKEYAVTVTVLSPYDKLKSLTIGGKLSRDMSEESLLLDSAEFNVNYNNATFINSRGTLNYQTKNIEINVDSSIKNLESLNVKGQYIKAEDSNKVSFGVQVHYNNKAYLFEGWYEPGETARSFKFYTNFITGPKVASELVLNVHLELRENPDGLVVVTKINYNQDSIDTTINYQRTQHDDRTETSVTVDTQTTMSAYKNLRLDSTMVRFTTGNTSVVVDMLLPVTDFEQVHLDGFYFLMQGEGAARLNLNTPQTSGHLKSQWATKMMENMALHLDAKLDSPKLRRHYVTDIYYKNKEKLFKHLESGIHFADYNKDWQLGGNATVVIGEVLDAALTLVTPEPYPEVYRTSVRMTYPFQLNKYNLSVDYEIENAKLKYGLDVEGQYTHKVMASTVSVKFTDAENTTSYRNFVEVKTPKPGQYDVVYKLRTPLFEEETVVLNALYSDAPFHSIRSAIFYPESQFASTLDLDYHNMWNITGTLNTTTPIKGLDIAGVKLNLLTETQDWNHYLELFWNNNSALLSSKAQMDTSKPDTQINGTLLIEVPITTRHVGLVNYEYYMEDDSTRIGHTLVQYNQRNVLEARLRSNAVLRRGYDSKNIYLEVENQFTPLGIRYNHLKQFKDENPAALPKTEFQRVEVFKLRNEQSFNLTGQLEVLTNEHGKEIKITAMNPNRTVHLSTDYMVVDRVLHHKSRIQLEPEAWLAYNVVIANLTEDEEFARKRMTFNLQYPERNLTFKGNYTHSSSSLSSDVALFWERDKEEKTIGAAVDWKKISVKPIQQVTAIHLRHPSLERDVSLTLNLYRDERKLYDIKADLEYVEDEEEKLEIFSHLQDDTLDKSKAYKLVFGAKHPATTFDLKVESNIKYDGKVFQTSNYASYMRSYLPLSTGEAHAKLNITERSIELERANQDEKQYFKGWYDVEEPLYTASFTAIPGTEQKAEGYFYVNAYEYDTALTVNTSKEENYKNLYMTGRIPDARNAMMRVWRNYDGVIIPDASYYLKLNHSRLITSKFVWRAELPDQLAKGANDLVNFTMQGSYEFFDGWREYIQNEANEEISDIWFNSKHIVEEALQDLNDTKEIRVDMLKLYTYLNTSYYENHFYVKDIVGVAVLLIDEFSLRRHLENLPELVSEVWAVLGESGESLRQSLMAAIAALKEKFSKLVEMINSLRKGEANESLTSLFDSLRENYDKFIKDLRIAFTQRVENFRKKFSDTLRAYLKSLQQMLTPLFLKLLHLTETAFVKAGNEISSFFYEKKKEITESEHYQKLAMIAQDIIAIYKDISKNDTITNIKKYSTKAYDFFKEKYVNVVPFGKEFHDLVLEMWEQIKELRKLSSVSFVLQKLDEVYEKLEWLYQKFDVGGKLNDLILFFHLKIYEISQTALDAENNNREAKTKFIFEPAKGFIELEQKLPISWHSFNERPNYEEIPEYKLLTNMQNYFSPNNNSLLHYYGLVNKYMDPSNWLPPFKAQAMLVGSQHLITFDHRVIHFQGGCSYLLAHDFADGNFTVIAQYNAQTRNAPPAMIVLLENDVIKIDLADSSIQINDKYDKRLPTMTADGTFIYREGQILHVKGNKSFEILCNFHFDICTLELSGWYFGKTAGLFGTMDNEQATDLLSTNGSYLTSVPEFVTAWQLDDSMCTEEDGLAAKIPDAKIVNKCDVLYDRDSPMADCFSVVDYEPFKEMCLTSKVYKDKEACISAKAYMEECSQANVIITLPDECIWCDIKERVLANGEIMEVIMENEPWTTDIVLIVEAKDCNGNISRFKHIQQFLNILNVELREANITNNRFGVVTFGGDGVFDEPRTLMTNKEFSEVFASNLLDNLPIGNGATSSIDAITYAAKMRFRPKASKTFILIPCSNCSSSSSVLDYPFTSQMLAENDITLHMLIDQDISLNKSRVRNVLFGIDGKTAYTKKDVKELKGDTDLFRQLALPKDSLGLCLPLALESNGTVFTAKKIETEKQRGSKNFATVFSKRIAKTARPSPCLHCECLTDEYGASMVTCSPCYYPLPLESDMDEDSMLRALQPDYEKIKKLIEDPEMLFTNASHKIFQ